jgi:hypothetical protein
MRMADALARGVDACKEANSRTEPRRDEWPRKNEEGKEAKVDIAPALSKGCASPDRP